MLQAIRDHAKGVFAWVMLIVVGVPFALWGIQNYLDNGREAPLATVGDREIFERDVNRVYEQELANLVGIGDMAEDQLKKEAMERIIREELINQQARASGFAVSDDDLRAAVQEEPYFQTDGKFDMEKYKLALASQGMSSAAFSQQARQRLLSAQYSRGLMDSVFAPERMVEDFLKKRNQERRIEYITVSKAPFAGKIDESAVEAYFNSHQTDYQTPEKVAVDYVSLDLTSVAETMAPTEDDLKSLYEEQKAQYVTPEKRKVSHILLSADTPNPEVEKKAAELRQRLDKGEDFAKLAKEVSDDKQSGAKGGDLGYVSKDSIDPNVYAETQKLKQGEVSGPVRSPFGYHLVKVTELKPSVTRTFEEVHADLMSLAKHAAAEAKFDDLAQALVTVSFEHPESLEAAAQAVGAKVQTSALFSRDEGEGIAANPELRKAAFSDEVLDGKNSDLVEVGKDKAVVVHLKQRVPAAPKPLAEVRQSIVERLQQQAVMDETRKRADDLLAAARAGKALDDLAKTGKLTVSKPEPIRRNGTALPPDLVSAAFGISPSKLATDPYAKVELANGDQVVLRLLEIKDGASDKDGKEAATLRDSLARSLAQTEALAYFAALRAEADVHIRPQRQ
ncbi:MAG: peptidylprolyl isomerase [Methylococcaceae bacterium]|nr:peptidylprolyl isomerase [Methylococcaceae bacterium]